MPDLGDLLGFDDFGGDTNWDWLDELTNLGFDAGVLGNVVLDTETGQLVDIATLSPQDLAELDMSGSGSGPVGDAPSTGALDTSPISRSTSDQLRSLEGSPTTWTPGSEPFDPSAMADPSASIASAEDGSSGWGKALAQG